MRCVWCVSNGPGDTVSDNVTVNLGRCHHQSSYGCCDPQAGGVEVYSGMFM